DGCQDALTERSPVPRSAAAAGLGGGRARQDPGLPGGDALGGGGDGAGSSAGVARGRLGLPGPRPTGRLAGLPLEARPGLAAAPGARGAVLPLERLRVRLRGPVGLPVVVRRPPPLTRASCSTPTPPGRAPCRPTPTWSGRCRSSAGSSGRRPCTSG